MVEAPVIILLPPKTDIRLEFYEAPHSSIQAG